MKYRPANEELKFVEGYVYRRIRSDTRSITRAAVMGTRRYRILKRRKLWNRVKRMAFCLEGLSILCRELP
jgi:hypothetical protein